MLSFNAALLVREQEIGIDAAAGTVRPTQLKVVVKTASKFRDRHRVPGGPGTFLSQMYVA